VLCVLRVLCVLCVYCDCLVEKKKLFHTMILKKKLYAEDSFFFFQNRWNKVFFSSKCGKKFFFLFSWNKVFFFPKYRIHFLVFSHTLVCSYVCVRAILTKEKKASVFQNFEKKNFIPHFGKKNFIPRLEKKKTLFDVFFSPNFPAKHELLCGVCVVPRWGCVRCVCYVRVLWCVLCVLCVLSVCCVCVVLCCVCLFIVLYVCCVCWFIVRCVCVLCLFVYCALCVFMCAV